MSETTEKSKEENIMMQSIRQVAPDKLIGGMTVSFDDESGGTFTRKYHILFCNTCGDKIDESKPYSICKEDDSITCSGCSVKYNQKNICLDCFKSEHQLEKFAFMVLKCIEQNIANVSAINNLTRITNTEINDAKKFLESNNYVSKKFLEPHRITAKGIEILNIYESQIYKNEKDVVDFIERIKSIEC